jgi:hypothetical protein
MNTMPKRNRGSVSAWELLYKDKPTMSLVDMSLLTKKKRQELLENDWVEVSIDGDSAD